ARLANNIELSDIPPNFLLLVNKKIIKIEEHVDANSHPDNAKNKHLWVALGRWLGIEEPVIRRDMHHHLQSKWIDLKYTVNIQNNESRNILRIISYISRKEKAQCITDVEGRTLVHLVLLNNPRAVMQATDAVNHYYFYTLNNSSHRSDEFWKNFIEYFGAYTQNNLLLFTSSNTTSFYNITHQECINLGPLSTSVNEFVQEFYGNLYKKLEKLVWGPFASQLFGIFPIITINYNITSDYYWDEHDEPNSLIVVPFRPRQVVAFSLCLLLYGNFPLTKSIHHSIVYFVHDIFFHNIRKFDDIYNDLKDRIERNANGDNVIFIKRQNLNNAQGLNFRTMFFKPKKRQITIPSSSMDCRRGHISLVHARHRLRTEDPLPDL
ncbi:31890_t:CDS:2, partial [Racocetra persica]